LTYYQAKKKRKGLHFPGFRSRHRRIGGFGLANDKFRCEGNTAYLPKIGEVNMAEPLRFDGAVRSGRVVEDGGHWYLVVTVEIEKPESTAAGSVGIDFGLKALATLSDGTVYETQGTLRRAERKLRSLQRALARKQRTSANRVKAKRRVARFHARVKAIRLDYLHKMTTAITRLYALVCVEDLSLTGLCRTRLAKSFHDSGIGEAILMLAYKADELRKVDRFYPSSKLCGACGAINDGLTLSDRIWICACGTVHDRDLNAARNIHREGMSLTAGDGYLGVTPVELAASAPTFGLT